MAAMRTLDDELSILDPKLVAVFMAIAKGVAYIADYLRLATDTPATMGTTNSFGDAQLQADIRSDLYLYDCFKQCGSVETAQSEEQADEKYLGGSGFSVAFDPLDGSSIIGADWSVGSIFAIWAGETVYGQKVKDLIGAAYSMYGPRTILVLARPSLEGLIVQEFTLTATGKWLCTNPRVRLEDAPAPKYFAPANLRAAADNAEYSKLVKQWMEDKYTLRYSGGLCPDIHHMLSKGGGVFCNPASTKAPAKLRMLFEVAALAMIVESAGGASHDGQGSILERVMDRADERTVVALGSKAEVAKCVAALAAGPSPEIKASWGLM